MHSTIQIRLLIELYLSAFQSVLRGPDPEGADRAAPRLDDGTPLLRGEELSLFGWVTGHPRLGDRRISTSALIHVTEDLQWARTLSRWYRLGVPFAVDTSEAFPDMALAGYCVALGTEVLSLPLHATRQITNKRPQLMADKAFELGFDNIVPALTRLSLVWPPVVVKN